jgi:hypothetical protein
LYAPTVKFGFLWDDPVWYGRVVGKTFLELIGPMPDFQFYRPGTMLYNRLFLKPDDTFNMPIMHTAQIGWHLLNVALTFALSRRLGLRPWTALAASAIAGLCPFSYQAIAWAAPQQPMASALQNGAWLAYIAARAQKRKRLAISLSLLCFLVALVIQESTVTLSLVPLLTEWVLRRRQRNDRRGFRWRTIPWLALVYPLIAACFGMLWLLTPHLPDYTRTMFETQVVLYLLQGFIFPLIGRPAGYGPGQSIAPGALLALYGLTVAWLIAAAWRSGRGRQAVFGLALALLGIAIPAIELSYSYVSISSRLLYYSSPGVAMLWACALVPPAKGLTIRRLWRVVGAAALCLIAIQSALLLMGFQHAYAAGTAHLTEFIHSTQTGGDRLLYVNFPSRYTPKRPPYPIGHWRIILAPGSVRLGAFATSATGQNPQTVSRSMPWVDAEDRDASPYYTDMRGIVTQPGELYQLAHQTDAIYLSHYFADGTFELQWAGAITATRTPDCGGVTFGEILCLQEARSEVQSDRMRLTLTWLSLSPAQPHDTIFVHIGQPGQAPIAQSDGDFWLGMLPLPTLAPGDTIQEQRIIPLPEEMPSGQHEIRVGVYNRLTRERLPARTPQGDPLADDATVIGYLP